MVPAEALRFREEMPVDVPQESPVAEMTPLLSTCRHCTPPPERELEAMVSLSLMIPAPLAVRVKSWLVVVVMPVDTVREENVTFEDVVKCCPVLKARWVSVIESLAIPKVTAAVSEPEPVTVMVPDPESAMVAT